MKSDKTYHWIDSSEKERSCISFGKDTKRYNKSYPKASKGVFPIVYPA